LPQFSNCKKAKCEFPHPTDATGLPRGVPRSPLQKEARQKVKMPRACPVESHA